MSKKVAVMQPYFFPYIGYFQLMNCVDTFVVFDDVSFIKKGWINRNRILINSEPVLFTVPLRNSSQNKLIKDTVISYSHDWTAKFLESVTRSYSGAPYFKITFEMLSQIVLTKPELITELILKSFFEIANYLDINTKMIRSSSVYSNTNLKAEERIINICLREKADVYVNASGGKDIYSGENFDKSGLKLNFLRTKEIFYPQFKNEFYGSLSMIDVLMFNSKEKIRNFLNEYELDNA